MAGQGESPAVARRRVRLALRRARDATGLSQGAVADHMGWSVSKVQRIESGENAISGTDLRALLTLYGVADSEEIEQLSEEARVSRRQRWWTKPEYRDHLTPAFEQLLQFEAEATAIRLYQPALVPGMFQTPAYAKFLLGWFDQRLSDDERRVRFDVRMRRQKQVLMSGESPHKIVILDESVLKRKIGDFEVMADQLDQLAELARRPDVHIRLLPFDQGAVMSSGGHFLVLDFADDDPVLYREYFTKDFIDHDRKEVAFHRELFETYWARCYDEEKTARVILADAAVFRARLDSA